jgi:hypothetical protein
MSETATKKAGQGAALPNELQDPSTGFTLPTGGRRLRARCRQGFDRLNPPAQPTNSGGSRTRRWVLRWLRPYCCLCRNCLPPHPRRIGWRARGWPGNLLAVQKRSQPDRIKSHCSKPDSRHTHSMWRLSGFRSIKHGTKTSLQEVRQGVEIPDQYCARHGLAMRR